MGYQLPTNVPAWHVEIYWRSSIVGHLTGWVRAKDRSGEKTFRSKDAAYAYAEQMTGIPSLLVSFMSRKCVVVETARSVDWRDRLRARFNQRPVWASCR